MNNPTPETLRSPQETKVSEPLRSKTAQVEWTSAATNPSGKGRRSPGAHGRKLRTLLLFNLVLPLMILAAAGLAFYLLGKSEAQQRPADDTSRSGILKRLPAADVMPVRSLDEVGGRLDLMVDGVVVPFREVQLATEVAGRITFKDPVCEAGNFVRKGQLLFRIDPQDYQLEVDRLSQMREQEYQQLGEIDQEMSNAQRLLEVAEQDLELRRREVRRIESLPEGFTSEGELDQTRRAELQALQARVTLQNELALLEKRRRRLETSERLAATQLELAQLNLDRTKIEAPVSGVIVQEDAELNSFVQRGSPIITIEDTSKAEVAISLRMDQLHWVLDQHTARLSEEVTDAAASPTSSDLRSYRLPETEATIEYSVAGRDGEPYRWQGRLLRYNGIGLDPQTRTMPVSVVVDQPRRVLGSSRNPARQSGPPALVRGMFVRVALHIDPQTELVVIPASALKPENQVWRFQPDESVLEQAEPDEEPDSDDRPPQLASSQQGLPEQDPSVTAEAEQDDFDPDQWAAGSVRTVHDVRRVERANFASGRFATRGIPPGPAANASAGDEEVYWICEVGGQKLQAGDHVVTTPLSAVRAVGTTAVRVPVEQLNHANRLPSEQPESTVGIR